LPKGHTTVCPKDTLLFVQRTHYCLPKGHATVCPKDTLLFVQRTRYCLSKGHTTVCPKDTLLFVQRTHCCLSKGHTTVCPKDTLLFVQRTHYCLSKGHTTVCPVTRFCSAQMATGFREAVKICGCYETHFKSEACCPRFKTNSNTFKMKWQLCRIPTDMWLSTSPRFTGFSFADIASANAAEQDDSRARFLEHSYRRVTDTLLVSLPQQQWQKCAAHIGRKRAHQRNAWVARSTA